MKAHAEMTFKAELTELTKNEVELIRDAVQLIAALTDNDADNYEISKDQVALAKKMYAELEVSFPNYILQE